MGGKGAVSLEKEKRRKQKRADESRGVDGGLEKARNWEVTRVLASFNGAKEREKEEKGNEEK